MSKKKLGSGAKETRRLRLTRETVKDLKPRKTRAERVQGGKAILKTCACGAHFPNVVL